MALGRYKGYQGQQVYHVDSLQGKRMNLFFKVVHCCLVCTDSLFIEFVYISTGNYCFNCFIHKNMPIIFNPHFKQAVSLCIMENTSLH